MLVGAPFFFSFSLQVIQCSVHVHVYVYRHGGVGRAGRVVRDNAATYSMLSSISPCSLTTVARFCMISLTSIIAVSMSATARSLSSISCEKSFT